MVKLKFFQVQIPELKIDTKLVATSSESLIGRTSKYPLTDLTRGKNGEIFYKITKSDGDLVGKVKRMRLFFSYVARFVRRGVTKIDDSFSVNVKNGKMQLKTIIMTRKKVNGAVTRHLRKETRSYIAKQLEDLKIEEVFTMILKNDLQQKLSQRLKKIYPLAYCEIRDILVKSK